MSAAAATAPAIPAEAAPKKSKKLLFIIIGVVILALLGAGGAFYILKKNTAQLNDESDDEAVVEHAVAKPGTPPTFLPLDSMVVNLADPGGNRVVQLAITLRVQDEKAGEAIKVYMPSIRNSVLLLVSQRTADNILKPEGKEELAKAILKEISGVMGYEVEDQDTTGTEKKRRRAPPNPLQGVLFSSFIVQ